ncbi:PEP-CTERM sorting domain-containing protein [Bryobacter aggregatus]|uniref:PEP-CTERM sorting domain-containing protein n=1 Tax=Bryobacter aggregatus TaxID=360054 RepID=UPI0004E0F7B7|nr:PEP-CTERM sorting domain-containing protein [Bryobacter aggregatus]
MKRLLLLSTFLTSGVFATPMVYNNNYWYSSSDPNLYGLKENFQIQNISLDAVQSGGNFTGKFVATLNFNFGSNTLGPYTLSGLQISAADLFLVQGGAIAYGIPLITHGGTKFNGTSTGNAAVDAGDIYKIGNGISILTSTNLSSGYGAGNYGAGRSVWLKNDTGSVSSWIAGTSTPTFNGNCTSSACSTAEFSVKIEISHSATGEWLSFLQGIASGAVTPYFTDSTCGNDLLTGVPEPSTYVLMSGGLLLMGLRLRRKK